MWYVIDGLAHDLILVEPWMRLSEVTYGAKERTIFFQKKRAIISKIKARENFDKYLNNQIYRISCRFKEKLSSLKE